MNYFRKVLFIFVGMGVILHWIGWMVNHNLYQDLQGQAHQNKKIKSCTAT
ncbi:MAG: hypothetical protein ACJ76H_14705 [Bacteriovoracaceae bacterium]